MPHGLTAPTRAPWPTRAILVVLAVVVALGALPVTSSAPPLSVAAQQDRPDDRTPPGDGATARGEEVIVVLEEGADPVATAQELGVEPTHIYEEVFTGFAATMPRAAVAEARDSGLVEQISPDGRVYAETQTVGTGVRRVAVPQNPDSPNLAISSPIDADIAILDTGISGGGDLNVAGGTSCVVKDEKKDKKKDRKKKRDKKSKKKKDRKKKQESKKGNGGKQGKSNKKGKDPKNKKERNEKDRKRKKDKNKGDKFGSWNDDNGHGTHVAGIAAAIDNDQGTVGVAPGARVWAVKVLDANGTGSFSDVICGLNWVVQASGTFDVVNLSLSGAGSDGPCESSPLHQAVCNVVNAGIPVVVAAGNQGTDASTRVPASFYEVITVSAMADLDGAPGQESLDTCSGETDDTFLSFSNFGEHIDIAAPGACIASIELGGEIRSNSGTSSASPHVAGAMAHFIQSYTAANGSRPSPDVVRTWLLSEVSKPQDSEFGFSGDPDDSPEPLLWLEEELAGP